MFLKKLFKKSGKSISSTPHQSKPSTKQRKVDPTHIGDLGEYKLDVQLRQFPKEYKYLNSVQLANPKSQTGYSQVDHVLVTPYAIFVIEAKNYQGSIIGKRKYSRWLVNGKPTLDNPLRQNYSHIKALERILKKEFKEIKYVSVVSFTKRCTLKVDEELKGIESDELVVYDIKFTDYIERKIARLKSEIKTPLSESNVERVIEIVNANNIRDPDVRAEHIQKAKELEDRK